MSKSIRLELSDEVAGRACDLAKQTYISLETILARWVSLGIADTTVRELIRDVAPIAEEYSLGFEQQMELADLIARRASLTPAEQLRMDELLQRHRQSLVRQTQAITDWMNLAGGSTKGSDVTELTRLDSSMLYAIGYNLASETLEIIFNNGGIYRYFHVPATIYQELLNSEFPGRFLWTKIINLYPYERVGCNRS